jgi:hypothetical protein
MLVRREQFPVPGLIFWEDIMRSQLWQHILRGHALHPRVADTIEGVGDFRVVLIFALLGLALSLLAISQGVSMG